MQAQPLAIDPPFSEMQAHAWHSACMHARTMYCMPLVVAPRSPLRHFGLDKPGTKVGVAGLGGLGHMAVRNAVAMG